MQSYINTHRHLGNTQKVIQKWTTYGFYTQKLQNILNMFTLELIHS
jgi:hypothetical protein